MLKTRPYRLLVQAEFGSTTGFAGVAENLLDRLYNIKTDWGTRKFDITVMALGLANNPFENYNKKPYKVVPMYGDRNQAPFGHDYASDLVRRTRPDIVLAFGDTWMIDFWNNKGIIPDELRKTFKLIGYVAIDGYPVPKFWIDKYKDFDKLITFTKFGKDAIDERAKSMGSNLKTSYIYHGVDPQVFKPLPASDVENFKRSKGIGPEKKIIGMFSRNQPRKHHPEFIEFAAEFLEFTDNNPDYLFYFHTVEKDAGWDLPELIKDINELAPRLRFLRDGSFYPGQPIPEKKYNLEGRFIFPGINNPAQGYPVELLNMMYNICDAHVLLTSGEGWGCTLTEALSAGIPTFTNDYAAGAEVVRAGGGEAIKARDFTYRGSDHNFYRPHTDYKTLIEKVLNSLNNPDVKAKYKKKARAFALSNSWDIIVEDWNTEIDSMLNLDDFKTINGELV